MFSTVPAASGWSDRATVVNPPLIVIMGVSGCGKSSVGQGLAAALGIEFVEGDELHPPRNVALMAAGTPLNDADRAGWLQALAGVLTSAQADGRGLVVSCSALKRTYRDVLRGGAADVRFVFLQGSPALLEARVQRRRGHYMPASLLHSQLATLEPPDADEGAITIDIDQPTERIVDTLRHTMSSFEKIILHTGADGRACFRSEAVPLPEGKPQAMLSALMPSGGLQLRHSPVGFRSSFHCTDTPQWVFILGGQMEIGLQDGSSRIFKPGDHFYSDDRLPEGASFDPALHGHWSRQVGPDPLVTAFVRS
jgi:carbohydrate kinase (thermoresistant glucokinase family)